MEFPLAVDISRGGALIRGIIVNSLVNDAASGHAAAAQGARRTFCVDRRDGCRFLNLLFLLIFGHVTARKTSQSALARIPFGEFGCSDTTPSSTRSAVGMPRGTCTRSYVSKRFKRVFMNS